MAWDAESRYTYINQNCPVLFPSCEVGQIYAIPSSVRRCLRSGEVKDNLCFDIWKGHFCSQDKKGH